MTRTPQKHLQLTARDLRWLALIDRHGPQSSEFLFEHTRLTHRCRDTSLRRLQALRAASYLRLPAQQRNIAKADFNPYVYDLTKQGQAELAIHQESEHHARPTGHWWHAYWVSAITSAIEICATRSRIQYVPSAQILARRGVEIGIPVSGTKLIPDQLFALKYPAGYRTFALEVDRGTEPIRSNAARKSLQRSVAQYREVLSSKVYQRHYGLKSKLTVLWVFNSPHRQQQFASLLRSNEHASISTIATGDIPRFQAIQSVLSGRWQGTHSVKRWSLF